MRVETDVSLERERPPQKRQGLTERLDSINRYLCGFLAILAGISLTSMMLLVVGNAMARAVYVPFVGTPEVVGWLAALSVAFSLGYTQVQKGHVDIALLLDKLPARLSRFIHSIISLISIVFFTMVFWKLFQYALSLKEQGHVSETLSVAYYPLVMLMALGFAALSLALVVDLLKLVRKGGVR